MTGQRKRVSLVRMLLSLLMVSGLVLAGCAGQPRTEPAQPAQPAAAPAAPPSPPPATAAVQAPAKPAAPPPVPAKPAFDAEKYFDGKTIRIVVPYAAGGGVDLNARTTAPLLTKYIPGKPTVIVENRPGADGMSGMNWVYKAAKADGYNMVLMTGASFSQVFAQESGAEYDVRKMPLVGAWGEGNIVYGSTTKFKSAKDAYKRSDVIYAGIIGIGKGSTINVLSSFDALGTKVKGIEHPGGTAEGRAAVFRGELHAMTESPAAYRQRVFPEVKEGHVVPLWQTGVFIGGKVVRDPGATEIPTFLEAYKEITGNELAGIPRQLAEISAAGRSVNRKLLLPPGTPADVADAVAAAAWKAINDPDFEKVIQTKVQLTPRQDAMASVQRMADMPADVKTHYQKLFSDATR